MGTEEEDLKCLFKQTMRLFGYLALILASAHVQADFVHNDPDSEVPECPQVEGKTCKWVHNRCMCKGEIKTDKPEKPHTEKTKPAKREKRESLRRVRRQNWNDQLKSKLPKTSKTIRDKRQKKIRNLTNLKTSLMKARPRDPVMLNEDTGCLLLTQCATS